MKILHRSLYFYENYASSLAFRPQNCNNYFVSALSFNHSKMSVMSRSKCVTEVDCCGGKPQCGESKSRVDDAIQPKSSDGESVRQFYRRTLPKTCIAFGSVEGKKLFAEALNDGFMNCYFPLAAQFRTQDEPAFCGLTTLVMTLNALAVDPGRVWKGPWRWYHENMLDCCVPLTKIATDGITMEEFSCLAACNGLKVQTIRPDNVLENDICKFRDLLQELCRRDDAFVVCSYSRRILSQTGSGHFSPVGGYHFGRDMVLILDTARFKYPPHWVPLSLLWEAMLEVDVTTGRSRGFFLVQRLDSIIAPESHLFFKASEYFSVNAPQEIRSVVEQFIRDLDISSLETEIIGPPVFEEAVDVVMRLFEKVDDDFHLLTTRSGYSCGDARSIHGITPLDNCLLSDLISSIKSLPVYDVVAKRIDPSLRSKFGRSSAPTENRCDTPDCGAASESVQAIGAAEFACMFILSWPFEERRSSGLKTYVKELMEAPLPPILKQEIGIMRHQLRHLKDFFASD